MPAPMTVRGPMAEFAGASIVPWHSRTATVGPRSDPHAALPTELACICAICTCARHRCPQHPELAPAFDGTTTYDATFQGCPAAAVAPHGIPPWESLRPAPAPHPLLQSSHRRDFPGHEAAPVGPAAVLPADAAPAPGGSKVPFFGRTAARDYGAGVAAGLPGGAGQQVRASPDIASAGYGERLDCRTTHAHFYRPHAHLPATDKPDAQRPHRPAATLSLGSSSAPFEGTGPHERDYPHHAGARPAGSCKPGGSAASDAPFGGRTEFEATHGALGDVRPWPGAAIRVPPSSSPGHAADERSFATETSAHYTPKVLAVPGRDGGVCPAARLPEPPPPAAAPGLWTADESGMRHALWDPARRTWAA